MEREALLREKLRLQEEKAALEGALEGATGGERRRFRVDIALVEEQILDCQDQLRRAKASEAAKRQSADENAKRNMNRTARAVAEREDAYFQELLRRLAVENQPQKEHSSLLELAKAYRAQMDVLRHRIQVVEELSARAEEETIIKAERLRILKAMYRDVRDVAVICERYYDPSYRRNERYMI